MSTRRLLSAVTLLLLITFIVSAESASGTISYLEGSVQVSRNGRYLSPGNVNIGLKIESSDTVETGSDGYVEVEMNAPSAGSLVKVRPDSSFYFESSPKESPRRETFFQMLRGSLSLKVGRLSSRESYKVQTDTAVMAVRGTEFNVDMAADRSVLVTVPEGHVESKSGRSTIMAQPGTVAAVDNNAQMSAISIAPSDVNLYRQYWQGLRLEALKINAKLSIQQYS
ncbi:MAG: FecR domain-containing protein, partial [Spirochaetaceae bacterium]|nr:FecR domain-containing protein [Spirochaetaceae bacterium]